MQETRISWALIAFEQTRRAPRADALIIALALLGAVPANARYGGLERADTLNQAKMLVFLSRCSNAIAVFAIPRARNDIATHSD
jgi:hypothetical protein